MEELIFYVQGSSAEPCKVVFIRRSNTNLSAHKQTKRLMQKTWNYFRCMVAYAMHNMAVGTISGDTMPICAAHIVLWDAILG